MAVRRCWVVSDQNSTLGYSSVGACVPNRSSRRRLVMTSVKRTGLLYERPPTQSQLFFLTGPAIVVNHLLRRR
jgi:hypothetical protein